LAVVDQTLRLRAGFVPLGQLRYTLAVSVTVMWSGLMVTGTS